ncbi:MAG: LacI family DNA-binding transcriptional regulator [Inquilinus sp.]|uniref:LacI family DNA-binding transcriptional regulator n=1 Tax=Inquilinus sp. TaxID=1932117 RepID=UPI003F40FAE4
MTRRRSFASAQQVADRAGVSRSAVSRTFTPGASVSAETRRRVLAAAEALGYHVNHLARGLTRRSSNIVCIVASDLETPLRSRMVGALIDRLQHSGRVAMLIGTSGRGDADARSALRQILNYRADATIVLSGTPSEDITRLCIAAGQRVVLINRDDRIEGPDNIAIDSALPGRLAAAAFRRAGCRRLCLVTSAQGTPALLAREASFLSAARAEGIEPAVWRGGRTVYATGRAAAHDLLLRPDRPDAAFCISDLVAFGFLDAARHDLGLRVPEDLCVIGFDNTEQAGWSAYDLTTFDQSVDATGDAVMAALDAPEGTAPLRLTIPAPLVWRRTVRGPSPDRAG